MPHASRTVTPRVNAGDRRSLRAANRIAFTPQSGILSRFPRLNERLLLFPRQRALQRIARVRRRKTLSRPACIKRFSVRPCSELVYLRVIRSRGVRRPVRPKSLCASWDNPAIPGRRMFMGALLESIHSPADLKRLSFAEMATLAEEIREFLIQTLSKTGGHLGPNLGVVELTLALHAVFDTPQDKLLFDVSHQAYIHKILTGRRPQRLHAAHRKRARLLRSRSRRHCPLRGPGHGRRPRSLRRQRACRRRCRRRRLHQRHLL